MRPNTISHIRKALAQQPKRPTQAELLRDAERLFLQLFKGDEYFQWGDVRDWLRAYQLGYTRSHSETSDNVGPLSPDERYGS